ncbi:hypothetical protein [Alteromonas ponticola]|uniref:Uncharacterized protein n=1 Tax=Alteromonas ponticola TaxID=2720613 RepID=A0ABX1R4Y8_9ALTE|nr:hypothetical protein [Alteromonas ponticola]NMH60187.1 hypothetical protein [Alteromonas ponticola]
MGLWKFSDDESNKRQISLLSLAAPESLTDLDYLNPFIVRHAFQIAPWTSQLSGIKVLVVHPFTEFLNQQIKNIRNIPTINEIWPDDIAFTLLSPPVTFAGENTDSNWIDELTKLKEKIYKTDFDVCFIAAGAYGLPIAGFVKDLGKISIHLGGSLQLLFGITGSRWENQGYYDLNKLDGWIRPRAKEKPKLHQRIDASSYW